MFVWCSSLKDSENATDVDDSEWRALLDPSETARADTFGFAPARRRYLAAHALLRVALSDAVDRRIPPEAWRFAADAHGKPHVAGAASGAAPAFSLTHSDGLVVIALTDAGAVGIDAERVSGQSLSDNDAMALLTPLEAAAVRAAPSGAPRVRCFLEFWTLKEAHVKASGLGLSFPLRAPVFRVERDEIHVFDAPRGVGEEPARFYWQALFGSDHVVSLCLEAPGPAPVRVHCWRSDPLGRMRRSLRPGRPRTTR